MTRDDGLKTIEHIRDQGDGLTEWEVDFLGSVARQLEDPERTHVSHKQAAILERIQRERCP